MESQSGLEQVMSVSPPVTANMSWMASAAKDFIESRRRLLEISAAQFRGHTRRNNSHCTDTPIPSCPKTRTSETSANLRKEFHEAVNEKGRDLVASFRDQNVIRSGEDQCKLLILLVELELGAEGGIRTQAGVCCDNFPRIRRWDTTHG